MSALLCTLDLTVWASKSCVSELMQYNLQAMGQEFCVAIDKSQLYFHCLVGESVRKLLFLCGNKVSCIKLGRILKKSLGYSYSVLKIRYFSIFYRFTQVGLSISTVNVYLKLLQNVITQKTFLMGIRDKIGDNVPR